MFSITVSVPALNGNWKRIVLKSAGALAAGSAVVVSSPGTDSPSPASWVPSEPFSCG
jgi:hypothetical protein